MRYKIALSWEPIRGFVSRCVRYKYESELRRAINKSKIVIVQNDHRLKKFTVELFKNGKVIRKWVKSKNVIKRVV